MAQRATACWRGTRRSRQRSWRLLPPGLQRRVRRRRRSPPVVPGVRRAGTCSSGRTGSARCTRQAAAWGRTAFDRKGTCARAVQHRTDVRERLRRCPRLAWKLLMRHRWAAAHGDLSAREQLDRLRSTPRWPAAPRSETRAVPALERFGGLLQRWAGSDNGHYVNLPAFSIAVVIPPARSRSVPSGFPPPTPGNPDPQSTCRLRSGASLQYAGDFNLKLDRNTAVD